MAETPQYVTVEQLKSVVDSVSQELSNIKVEQFRTVARLETAIRFLSNKKVMEYGDFVTSTEDYRQWREGLMKCLKEQNLVKRVDTALELNATLTFKLFADDIEIISQVVDAGGTSHATATKTLELPHSEMFKKFISQYIIKEAEDKSTN